MVVKGIGFNSRGGGFTHLDIDGKIVPVEEIDRLSAELANARLERDNIASLNSSLIAELAEGKARTAIITQALETSCANVTDRNARIAELEAERAKLSSFHDMLIKLSQARVCAERANARIAELGDNLAIMQGSYCTAVKIAERAEAERDEERLMRKLYEDAAKHWQPLVERAEAQLKTVVIEGNNLSHNLREAEAKLAAIRRSR